jgi:hypothetical protein
MAFTTMPSQHMPSQEPDVPVQDSTEVDGLAFQPGEVITYKIYYNWNFVWLAAGEVTFKVFDSGNMYHYQARGKTYSSYEWFFQVQDSYNSWVSKSTLLPSYSEREVNEGDYHIFEKIRFKQKGKKAIVWRSSKRGEEETQTEHPTTTEVHDVLSTLYYLRGIDFEKRGVGSSEPFTIFMDKEEYPLTIKYVGKEANKKIHGMGKYNTMKFEPTVIAGEVFTEDAKMQVWVSDDQNRIPVLIESPVSVGSVKMVLKSYRGLKYDFNAKAK